MNTLKIDTGIQEYDLNGAVKVHFNPTDASFIQKLYDKMVEMDSKQAEYKAGMDAIAPDDGKAIFAFMKEKDADMRAAIDSVFDVPVCDALFNEMNVFAMTTDGLPVWANLFLAIIDLCDTSQVELKGKASAKVNQYLNKYQKKYHK